MDVSNFYICQDCLQQIKIPSPALIESEYKRKFAGTNFITAFNSAFIFEQESPLQRLIHKLKYEEYFNIGKMLGVISAVKMLDLIPAWDADYIVPVPIHRLKKADRGFNQAYYIALGFSRVLKLPIKRNIIVRSKFTETQTELNLIERRDNVEGAFIVTRPAKVKGKRIILLDDVITTGATVNECAKLLLQNSASKVYAASVGIAY